jgi:hypothetical protein
VDNDLQHAFARISSILEAHEIIDFRARCSMGIWQIVLVGKNGIKRGSADVDLSRAFNDAVNYYVAATTENVTGYSYDEIGISPITLDPPPSPNRRR